jgi:hypothetical protein
VALAVPKVVRSLSVPILAHATGAHPRTVERWRAGVQPRRRQYRIRLADLTVVLAVLGPGLSAQAQRQWLTASSAYLGGRRPIDELAAGQVERARGAAAAYAGGDPT